MSEQTSEPEAAAVQILLSLSDVLRVSRHQRYQALWMFADKLLPAITHGRAKQAVPANDVASKLPLPLFAVACLLLALQRSAPDGTASQDNKQVLKMVYTNACSALGESFTASHSSSRLVEAAAVVEREVKGTRQRLTSDHLVDMHARVQEAGLVTLQCVTLDMCCMILEMLYASADYSRSQPLECGGKLLAAAIIGSAFAITVEPARVSVLPFLSWLSDLSKHPKDIIKAQTEQVIACMLQ